MHRDFKGVWIPREIWLSKKLSLQEKCLLVEINSLDDNFGCIASNTYLGEFIGLSPNRTSEIISSLETKGYIKILIEKSLETSGWKTNRVIKSNKHMLYNELENESALLDALDSRITPSENRNTSSENRNEYSEKAEYINTYINTKSNTKSIEKNNKKSFIPPTLDEVKQYFEEEGYREDIAIRAYEYYKAGDWKDSNDKPVKRWKQKMRNWMKPENKIVSNIQPTKPTIVKYSREYSVLVLNDERRRAGLPEAVEGVDYIKGW